MDPVIILAIINGLFKLAASIAKAANIKIEEIDNEWRRSAQEVYDRPACNLPQPPA